MVSSVVLSPYLSPRSAGTEVRVSWPTMDKAEPSMCHKIDHYEMNIPATSMNVLFAIEPFSMLVDGFLLPYPTGEPLLKTSNSHLMSVGPCWVCRKEVDDGEYLQIAGYNFHQNPTYSLV